jgi:DNA-binding XRE family transcriptional regulator
MLAVVKTPRTDFKIQGKIPYWIISKLKRIYGSKVKISDTTEEKVDVFQTNWFSTISKRLSPGKALKTYRNNFGWTQQELGNKLGGLPRQHICGMEKGSRPISKKMAKMLSKLFKVSVERFL